MSISADYEALDLAACIFGLDEDSESLDDEVESHLSDRWGIDFDTFHDIARELIRFAPLLKSPLSGKLAHVFGRIDGKGFVALMKQEVEE